MKPLWSQSIYRYVLLYIVDNTGGHDIDYGRKELMNYLSFFSYEHLNESFLLTWAVVAVDETSGSSEWPSTRYIARNSVRGWSYINLLVLPCPNISWGTDMMLIVKHQPHFRTERMVKASRAHGLVPSIDFPQVCTRTAPSRPFRHRFDPVQAFPNICAS